MKERPKMKGRDIEALAFFGKAKQVTVEFCDDEKRFAKVVAVTVDGEEVETECIPTRAAGKISTMMKNYIKLNVGKYIITSSTYDISQMKNTDTEGEENEAEDRQDS
ncbi:MAG: hypothetical protein OWQ54_01205 [Sulfolobaceae archaeon]|nr:hypothetical protein [Sulfolobaceae archaeon]